MPLMMFNAPVKYKGVRYEAGQHFRIDSADVLELKKDGGRLLDQAKKTSPTNKPESQPFETKLNGENEVKSTNGGEEIKLKTTEELGARLEEIDNSLDDLNKAKDEFLNRKDQLVSKGNEITTKFENSEKTKADKKEFNIEIKKVSEELKHIDEELKQADTEINKLEVESEQVEKELDSLVQGDE